MWYDLNDVLSKNRLYSFIIGNRGGGKTFACQKWCIKDFIKNGNKSRKVLALYNKEFLDKNMYVCAALTIVFYPPPLYL